MTVLLCTTTSAELSPVVFRSQRVVELWPEFSSLLRKLGGEAGGGLLAEPEDHGNGRVDWYGTLGADISQEELVRHFQALRAAIEAAIDQQGNALSSSEKTLLPLLPYIFTIPGEEYIRSGVSGPVLVGWGHHAVTDKLTRVDITGAVKQSSPSAPALAERPSCARMTIRPPPLVVEPRPAGAWRAWLVLSAMLTGLALLIWLISHLGGLFAPAGCSHPSLLFWVFLLASLVVLAWLAARLPWRAWIALRRVRKVGVSGGVLQVILAWNDLNDLDLHVICPDGQRIYFNRREHCGGVLRHDANARRKGALPPTNHPVETVAWTTAPPPGLYTVVVDPFAMPAAPTSHFSVTVCYYGTVLATRRGSVSVNNRIVPVCNFGIPA
ncbi:hypothetical protein PY793_13340 [Acetobacter fabarum]|uniref:hypothetical protein n=1 Tax=Acetobacter fabarum TaxID=483199 RepID=UPI00312B8DF6